MIDIPEYYDKMDPPEEAVANITIMDIMDVDEDDSSYVVYFRLIVKWYDRKLDFHYLKNKDYANIIPEEYTKHIWIPEIDFSFVQHSYDLQQIKRIYVQKTKIKRVKSDLIFPPETYDGASNPLIYVSEHRMTFFCEFNGITEYPFVTNICSFYIYFGSPGSPTELMTVRSSIRAQVNKIIGQYVVTKWEIKYSETYEKEGIKVSVSLKKNPLNIILVTYLPSLLMNIINQAINYITGDSKHDLIITVNITSMVVLATIYMSVSTSLPSTDNIKPIEVWLLFNLAYPILVILANVVMKAHDSENSNIKTISPTQEFTLDEMI